MNDELISINTAMLAKEHGFDMGGGMAFYYDSEKQCWIDGFYCYTEDEKNLFLARPSQAQLQKWLISEHCIFVEVSLNFCPDSEMDFGYGVSVMSNINEWNNVIWHGLNIAGIWFKTYEQALEEGLKQALELI